MHIVLATFGSHGDVHPFVGLAKTLADRGHDVTLHTSAYFEGLARDAGVKFDGFGTAAQFKDQLANPKLWSPREGYKAVFGVGVKHALRPSYDGLKKIVTKDTLLVSSTLALSARILHDELGCPGATVHLAPAVIRSSVAPPKLPHLFMPTWLPMSIRQKIWEVGDKYFVDPVIAPDVNALRAELGLPPVSRLLNGWWNHPELILGLWPAFFGPAASDWPSQFRHAGFPLYDESEITPLTPELEAFLAKHPKPIAFTPGSAMLFGEKFFNAAVGACLKLKRPGLLLTRHPEAIPKNLPPTVLHVPYAPFSKLLPRCCAIVHHGGIGTTSQALAAGIPQVVTYFAHDQLDNAYHLRRLGVGAGFAAGKISATRLAAAIDGLLGSPKTVHDAANTARQVSGNGLVRAAELLEAAVANARVG